MDNVENEKKAITHGVDVARLMADQLQQHDRENKRLWAIVIGLIISLAFIAGAMAYVVQNGQEKLNEAVFNALEKAAEVTYEDVTEMTQTVDGENSTINNVEGEQYNGNAKKIVGGEE